MKSLGNGYAGSSHETIQTEAARMSGMLYIHMGLQGKSSGIIWSIPALPGTGAGQSKMDLLMKGDTDTLSLIVSVASMLVAIFTLYFTVRLWRKSNRPLVTARVSNHSSGNINTALELLVENSGTRPAFDVRLEAREEDVRAAMVDPAADIPIPKDAQRVFFSAVSIPVLANGRTAFNAFGMLGEDAVWRAGARLPIKVIYRSLDGAEYAEPGELLLFDDDGFAQTSWGGPRDKEISHHVVRLDKRASA